MPGQTKRSYVHALIIHSWVISSGLIISGFWEARGTSDGKPASGVLSAGLNVMYLWSSAADALGGMQENRPL